MLQIRLSKAPSADGPVGTKPAPVDTVTVVCPDHLILADLPVAKGIGAAIAASLVKTVGRRSRRQLGERVHFCVRCDFPIAIYGRLSPCDHAFCLDCARSDSICYLCDERIQKIQTIKLMEGIFICAAPHCLKSFLKRVDFESHIHDSHSELLQTNTDKEDNNNNNNNESEAQSVKQSSATESTLRAPLRPVFSPSSNSQIHDRDDKNRRSLAREQSLPRPLVLPKLPPQGFGIQQQSFDSPGGVKQEPESPFRDYPPMHTVQPPSYMIPNPNTPFGYSPFPGGGDGPQAAFYGAPYEMGRQDSTLEAGSDHGSLLGFPPGPNYHQPWNAGPVAGMPFEPPPQGIQDGFANISSDSQGKTPFYQGEFGRNKSFESLQGGEPRDVKGILAPPQLPPASHISQPKRKFYSDMSRDGQSYGWQHENRDGFGSSQD